MQDDLEFSGRFVFDDSVAERFDDMITRSIPGMDLLREETAEYVRVFLDSAPLAPGAPRILDLGCSLGTQIQAFRNVLRPLLSYVGVDASAPMAERAMARFAHTERVRIVNASALSYLEEAAAAEERIDVVVALFTLQFMAPEDRVQVLRAIADVQRARSRPLLLLVAEKVVQAPDVEPLVRAAYYGMKSRVSGYDSQQIATKELALRNVLVPLTEAGNLELLRSLAPKWLSLYWAAGPFRAWALVLDS